MMIRLRVQETRAQLKVNDGGLVRFKAEHGIPIYPNEYTGAYEVTPTQGTQVLDTRNLMMTSNVTVNPIPSNYGKITWDGRVITVS